jgi:hypothetical protein
MLSDHLQARQLRRSRCQEHPDIGTQELSGTLATSHSGAESSGLREDSGCAGVGVITSAKTAEADQVGSGENTRLMARLVRTMDKVELRRPAGTTSGLESSLQWRQKASVPLSGVRQLQPRVGRRTPPVGLGAHGHTEILASPMRECISCRMSCVGDRAVRFRVLCP